MKSIKWVSLAMILGFAAQAQSPPPQGPASVPANLSPAVSEVTRLAEAGTSEEVMMAYVQNSTAPFNLSTDQILYLRDIGIPSGVVSGMLTRDSVLRAHPQAQSAYAYEQRAYPATVSPPPPVAPVAEPVPFSF